MEAKINIKGAEIALYFGMPAATGIFQNADFLKDHKDAFGAISIAVVLHEGYKNAMLLERKPEVLQFKDFLIYAEDAIIDGTEAEAIAAFNAFQESRVYKKFVKVEKPKDQPTAEQPADDEKKSLPKTKRTVLSDSALVS